MEVTNIHEAKTHFSKLVERAEAGEEIVIGKAGKPVAKLVPYTEKKFVRKPGGMKIEFAPDYDSILVDKEIEALFYGEPIEPPARHARPVVVDRSKQSPLRKRASSHR
ncbi:MAG: type II toxin-antitoxin system Phd/YefM family antitoxin [Acidobacteriota bacterium]